MKTVFAALAATLILPGAALAQSTAPAETGAAGRLPNTFDAPARNTAQLPPAPAAAARSDPAKAAAAEAMLKTTIAAIQAGAINYSDMTPDLADKVRAQAANVLGVFGQLGALESVTHSGTQDGAELFTVAFANAPLEWLIALNPEGKIVALLFRPAPPPAA